MDQLAILKQQSKAEPYQALLKDVLEQLMDIELTETIGYDKGVRSPNGGRQPNTRNGYRFRGSVKLQCVSGVGTRYIQY